MSFFKSITLNTNLQKYSVMQSTETNKRFDYKFTTQINTGFDIYYDFFFNKRKWVTNEQFYDQWFKRINSLQS